MNKRRLSLVLALVMVLTVMAMPFSAFAAGEKKEIHLFHINDIHGRAVENEKDKVIGYAKLKGYADKVENKLILDAGDNLHGTPFATISRGQSMVDVANAAGVNVLVPGNHDYNYGYERLVELKKAAQFDVVSANVKKGDTTLFPGHVIKEVDGVKIGIFGLTTPETRTKSNPLNTEGLVFTDYIADAKREVAALKAAGAQVVVGLVHLGLDQSSVQRSDLLAKQVPEIDVIIDGHSHTALEKGQVVNNVLIAQTGGHFSSVGDVKLTFENGKLVGKEAVLLSPETFKDVTPDPKVLEVVKKAEDANKPYLEKKVGETKVELDGVREHVRTGETNLGNLLTDGMRDLTGAQVAITNGGGIRASIPAGQITMAQIMEAFPFNNYPVKAEVKGDVILKALEHGVDKAPEVVGKFPHVSGVTFSYDENQPAGSRVFNVKVGGQNLDPEKTYTLVTNDFMFVGGDGYEMFKGAKKLGEYKLLSEMLADYIAKKTPVDPKVENRVVKGTKPAGQGFTDVQNHWAEKFINDVVGKKLFNGMTPNTFEPNTKISRAMVVTVLGRLEESQGHEIKGDKTAFTDVQDVNVWYGKYVAWASANGIVKGYEDQSFKPAQEVTRQELAAMVARYLYDYKKLPAAPVKLAFGDTDAIADWAKEPVSAMVGQKILQGRENNTFDPLGTATRGELAKILSLISSMDVKTTETVKKEEPKKEEVKKEEVKKEEAKTEKAA